MNDAMSTIGAIATAVIGLAIVAVLVSSNSQTGSVVTDASSGFASILNAATLNSGGTYGASGVANQASVASDFGGGGTA